MLGMRLSIQNQQNFGRSQLFQKHPPTTPLSADNSDLHCACYSCLLPATANPVPSILLVFNAKIEGNSTPSIVPSQSCFVGGSFVYSLYCPLSPPPLSYRKTDNNSVIPNLDSLRNGSAKDDDQIHGLRRVICLSDYVPGFLNYNRKEGGEKSRMELKALSSAGERNLLHQPPALFKGEQRRRTLNVKVFHMWLKMIHNVLQVVRTSGWSMQ